MSDKSAGMEPLLMLSAVLAAIFMATIGIFSKITGLSAQVITVFRLGLGALFMLVFLAATRQTMLAWRRPSLSVLASGGFLAGFIIFYVQSMNYTSMANAIMLIYLAPLAASVVAHFFLGERLDTRSVVLIGLALFGFAMMMNFHLDISGNSREFIGISYGLLAMLAYAGFIVTNRMIRDDIHVYTRTIHQLATGALVMLPFALTAGDRITVGHIPWLLATGLFPGFLAILFAVIALSRLPAATFGTIAYLEPVAVVLFGWTIFAETLGPMQITGCLVIIASGITKTLTAGREQRGGTAGEKSSPSSPQELSF